MCFKAIYGSCLPDWNFVSENIEETHAFTSYFNIIFLYPRQKGGMLLMLDDRGSQSSSPYTRYTRLKPPPEQAKKEQKSYTLATKRFFLRKKFRRKI